MENIDTNVSNYTLSELMAIVEVEDLNFDSILENTNYWIKKYKNKNPSMSIFFKEIQSQLLQYAQGLENENDSDEDTTSKIIVEGFGNMTNDAIYPSGEKMVSDWYEKQVLPQNDKNQTDKITDRKQKIQCIAKVQCY